MYTIRRLCSVMQVHPSGYYAWLKEPVSKREQANIVLTQRIKEAYEQSGKLYGYRNINKDLKEAGIIVNKKRVARLMSINRLYGAGMIKRKPKHKAGIAHKVHPNHLQQCFVASKPNQSWVTDITYIRTHEGWLYLAVVLDLFSRRVIGWAMNHRMSTDLVISALKMAHYHTNPKSQVLLHSDQGSQFSSYDWSLALKTYNIKPSMSRRGNCYDNAVVESFFKTLKKEAVRKHVFSTREEAKQALFAYIEMFYNTKRRHSYLGYISPIEFEKRYNQSVNSLEVLTGE